MFDSIIKGVNEKYDLGDKAGALVAGILALMTDRGSGGFAGFINRFRAVGLGDLADSWVSSGANTPVSYEQLESALGEDILRGLSEKAGTDYKTTVGASEYIVPHLVDDLTPDGEFPDENDLLSRAGGYLTGIDTSPGAAGQNIDRVDAAAELIDDGVPRAFETGSSGDENALLSWLLPLLILGLLVILGFWFCGGKSEPVATVNTNVNQVNTNTANANTGNANAVK